MKNIFCFHLLGLIAVLLTLTPARAESSSPQSTFRSCSGDWTAWKTDLRNLDESLETWAKAHPTALTQSDLDERHEGRLIQLFGAHLLPKGSPFAQMHKICWTHFVDFEKAIDSKNRVEAEKSVELWKACLKGNSPELPTEASELLACWKKSVSELK